MIGPLSQKKTLWIPLLLGIFAASVGLVPVPVWSDEKSDSAISQPLQPELKTELKSVYLRWRRAMQTKDYTGWNETMAKFRQMQVRNLIVSQGGKFPDQLFNGVISPPDVETLTLLDARTTGAAANLIYFGKVNMGAAEGLVPDNVLILNFVLDRPNGWRFEKTRFINLAGIPKVRADLQAGKLDFLKNPEFEPRETVPEIPRACPDPEFLGRIDIAANGYAVSMEVNGFKYPEIIDTGRRNMVIGGFRTGGNRLILKIEETELPKGEKRLLQLVAFASDSSKKGVAATRVFLWTPEDVPMSLDTEIVIDRSKF